MPIPSVWRQKLPNDWFKRAYRRAVVDMHITDDNPEFMSKFDPEEYVEKIALAVDRLADNQSSIQGFLKASSLFD